MSASTQADASRDEKGLFKQGNKPKEGFHTHPERRGRGFWKKESTPRYKLEQMMKLSEMELKKIATDEQAPLFERKLAIAIRKGEWKEIEAMINQVYGKPNQSIDMTSNGETVAPTTLVRFVDDRSKNT